MSDLPATLRKLADAAVGFDGVDVTAAQRHNPPAEVTEVVQAEPTGALVESPAEQLSLIPPAPLVLEDAVIGVGELLVQQEIDLTGSDGDRSFEESIAQFGVLKPIILQRLPDGERCRVVDGRRRLSAAAKAGQATIPARIAPVDAALADVLTLLLNEQRGPNPAAELAAIERLIARGCIFQQISEATGLQAGQIKRRLRLTALAPELRRALDEGAISANVAEQAAKLPKTSQERLFLTLQLQGKLRPRDVSDLRKVEVQAVVQTLPDSIFGPIDRGTSASVADVVYDRDPRQEERERIAAWLYAESEQLPPGQRESLEQLADRIRTNRLSEVR